MPDTHNCKNFFDHGGNELVVGGKLTVLEGATVEGLADAEQLVAATADTLGCVKASAKAETDTVPAKIGTDGVLYVPTYPEVEQLVAATADTLGGVKAAAKAETDTVPAKIGADGVLYVPTYPDAVTPAANQADSTATTVAALKDDLNALLAKLKAAGLMEADAPDGEA